MPIEAYDADGNLVEGLLAPEEALALSAQLEETKVKLSKLENKEFNFRKLEQMTEEERSKLSATELGLKKKEEEIDQKVKDLENNFVTGIKDDIFGQLIGDDDELKKKAEHHFSRLPESKTARSRAEIESLVRESILLSTGGRSRNPLTAAMGQNGSGISIPASKAVSEDVLDMANKMGISKEDLEKYAT